MTNTDKQLAELVAEEKKLIERQKNEQDTSRKNPYHQETDPGGTAQTLMTVERY